MSPSVFCVFSRCRPRLTFGAAAILAVVFSFVASAQTVRVHSRDGTVVAGRVDDRTDRDLLWIRATGAGVVVRSAVPWDRVAEVVYQGRRFSAEQFRPVAERLRRQQPAETGSEPAGARRTHVAGAAGQKQPTEPAAGEAGGRRRAVSLSVEAMVANWDADVETDGLHIGIRPLDRHGRVVPVRGTVRVELYAQRIDQPRTADPFPQIARWSRPVRPEEFGVDGAVYHLEFQRVHPEFDLHFSTDGLVHVTLGIAGQGTLEASSFVWLRSFNPFREQLELYKRRRFLPAERISRRSRGG